MPDSRSGAWAGLWFLEGGGEIDLVESGYTGLGSDKVNRVMASNLHTSGNSQKLYDTGVDLSADYHVYGMDYKPGKSVTIYFDGK
jgi:beta-glucanase (GH16 family)